MLLPVVVIEVPVVVVEKVLYYIVSGLLGEQVLEDRQGRTIGELVQSAPESAYGFRYCKELVGSTTIDGHPIDIGSKAPFHLSPMIYLGGEVYEIGEIKDRCLLENIGSITGNERVIRSCRGTWQLLQEGDTVYTL